MTRKIITGFLWLFLMTVAGCSHFDISNTEEFDPKGWNKFDHKVMVFNIPKTDNALTVDFNFVLNKHFPENEFSFQILMDDLRGDERQRNFSFEVKNREGDFTGTPRGDSFEYQEVLFPKKFFNKAGKYRITLVNLMPKINTPGIESFTLRIHQ